MPTKNGGSDEPSFEPNRRKPAKAERGEHRRFSANKVSYDGVSNQLLRDAIVAVTNADAALLLGRTSDGGAFTVQVYDGDERIREWPHSVEEVESVLKWLCDVFPPD